MIHIKNNNSKKAAQINIMHDLVKYISTLTKNLTSPQILHFLHSDFTSLTKKRIYYLFKS